MEDGFFLRLILHFNLYLSAQYILPLLITQWSICWITWTRALPAHVRSRIFHDFSPFRVRMCIHRPGIEVPGWFAESLYYFVYLCTTRQIVILKAAFIYLVYNSLPPPIYPTQGHPDRVFSLPGPEHKVGFKRVIHISSGLFSICLPGESKNCHITSFFPHFGPLEPYR